MGFEVSKIPAGQYPNLRNLVTRANSGLPGQSEAPKAGPNSAANPGIVTEPADPLIVPSPRLSIIKPSTPTGEKKIFFTTEPGRSYTVERSTDLKNWKKIGDISALDNLSPFVDRQPSAEKTFYRLRVNG